jgi:hypothetical protein
MKISRLLLCGLLVATLGFAVGCGNPAASDGTETTTPTTTTTTTTDPAAAAAYVNTGIENLTAKKFTEARASFALALASDPTNVDAQVWKALLDAANRAVNPDIVSLFKENFGFSGYPSDLTSLLSSTFLSTQIYYSKNGFVPIASEAGFQQSIYLRGTFTPNSSGKYINYYNFSNPSNSSTCEQGTFSFSDAGDSVVCFYYDEAGYYASYDNSVKLSSYSSATRYVEVATLADLSKPYALLPEISVPSWAPSLKDNNSISAYAMKILANVVDRNTTGINGIVDKVLSGAFGSDFDTVIAAIRALPSGASVTVPAALLSAYSGGSAPSYTIAINKDELLAFAGQQELMKGLVQYVASYNLTYPIGVFALDYNNPELNKDTDGDGISDWAESYMSTTVSPLVTSSGLLTDRSQATRTAAKTTIVTAMDDLYTAATNISAELKKTSGAYSAYFTAESTAAADMAATIDAVTPEVQAAKNAISGGGGYSYTYSVTNKGVTTSKTVTVYPSKIFDSAIFSFPSLFEYSGGKPVAYAQTYASSAWSDPFSYRGSGTVNAILMHYNTTTLADVWPEYSSFFGSASDALYWKIAGTTATAGLSAGEIATDKWLLGL